MDNNEDKLRVQKLLDSQDPRVYASDLIEVVSGGYALAGASTNAKFAGKEVSFVLPSHAALCLNLSHKAYKEAQQIPDTELFQNKSYGWSSEEGLTVLFNLFEQLFLNVIFAYTALETFANEAIPDDYIFTQVRQDKKYSESYDRDQIERNLSLDTKLSELLPQITGVKFSKGGSLWSDYVKLKKIRDRLIHVKTADTGLSGSNQTNIWTDLISQRKIDASLVAHKVIQHFPRVYEPSSPVAVGINRWVSKFPFA